MKLVRAKKIELKNNPKIKEDAIQQFIYDDPSCLGLGELTAINKEKIQPAGGRLDLLFVDDDNTRYEIEVQLGPTDPSHIIRTIEYWDNERKRYPQYDHCAVIVAEEITNRLYNIIQLFNGSIPLIALQMEASEIDDEKVQLNFVKVLDRVTLGTDEDDVYEPTDRKHWEKKSGVLEYMDLVFENASKLIPNIELNYNKYYIGLKQNGSANNFMAFEPHQKFIYLRIRLPETDSYTEQLNDSVLDFKYDKRYNREYFIKITRIEDYNENKELLESMIKDAYTLKTGLNVE